MTTSDPVDMLLSGRMDRRAFHQMLGGLGLGLAVTPLVSRHAWAAEEEASFFTWSGYEAPQLHQSYIDKYGVSPTVSFFDGTSESCSSLRKCRRGDETVKLIHETLAMYRVSYTFNPLAK